MAETILRTKGAPDLRIVEIEHPLGGIGPEALAERVEAAAEQALRHLDPQTRSPTGATMRSGGTT